MSPRRDYSSYNDGCATAHALDLIGERWTLIVVRELLLGPKRFAELQRDILGIGPTVLSRRLQELEARGIAVRRTLPAPARVDVYELTPWGARLEAVNAALSMWGVESPSLPWDADMSPDTLVLAMRAHARGVPRLEGETVVNLHLVDSRVAEAEPVSYTARLTSERAVVEKSPTPPAADSDVFATTADWKACVIGGRAPADLPEIRVTGSDAGVQAILVATRFEGASVTE